MVRFFITLLIFFQISTAAPLTLKKILENSDDTSVLMQAITRESLAAEARNKAEVAHEPFTLYGSYTKAEPLGGVKENEYTVGISKNIPLGTLRSQDKEILRLQSQADHLEAQKSLLNFTNHIKDLYHQHCIDKKNYYSIKKDYEALETLYQKKQKALEYQEISRIELMQIKLEKEQLYAMLQSAKILQKDSRLHLFKLTKVPHKADTPLSCQDLYPVKSEITLFQDDFRLSKEAYQKRLQSTQNAIQRHDTLLESVELSVQYDNEVDMERYSVGVSLPLSFTSERSEQKRLEAMHSSSAITHRHEYDMREKSAMFASLKSNLRSQALTVNTLRSNLKIYTAQLLPLMEKSYLYGESPLTEYLLNRQKYHQFQQSFYHHLKAYYHTLFRLYTLSEQKDNS